MTKFSIYELFDGYNQALKDAHLYAENLAYILKKVISKHIPDLEITIGGIEVGIDGLVFNSESHSVGAEKEEDDGYPVSLESIIISIFPDIVPSYFHLDSDFGVYVNRKLAKAIKRDLRKLQCATVSTDWIADSLEMSE